MVQVFLKARVIRSMNWTRSELKAAEVFRGETERVHAPVQHALQALQVEPVGKAGVRQGGDQGVRVGGGTRAAYHLKKPRK